MSTRSTLIGLFLVFLVCGALVFGVVAYFGRDADMRSAEIAFREKYGMVSSASVAARPQGPSRQATGPSQSPPPSQGRDKASSEDMDDWYGESSSRSGSDLDNWYAAAGASDGPADPTPEDKSYLVNDTQPLVSTDPL